MEKFTGQEQPRFVSSTATGKVPEVCDPEYSFDENNQWVFKIPEDVTRYLEEQFGEGVEIQVRGNEPQRTSAGYCAYNALIDGEVVGGIHLGGRSTTSPDGRTGVRSEWKLFKRQETQ